MTRDVYRFINEMDEAVVRAVGDRLEFRGGDASFTAMREAYFDRLPLVSARLVLAIGCGTGVEMRALARRAEFGGRVIGVDQSPALVEHGRRLASQEGVAERLEFRVGDALCLDLADASVDIVLAHTVLSHVADPLATLHEAARVVQAAGWVAVFDGDYASLTWSHPDANLARTMDEALIATVVNNPRVLRDMPRLLHEAGLELVDVLANVYSEVGTGRFFAGAAESYAPMVKNSGLVAGETVDAWLEAQRRALEQRTFFAACNYYSYLACRPGAA
jgi:ubiquinone/menaquinone biosynthesis C-methylase UbiE